MSLFTQLQQAATQAQSTLAQMMGAEAADSANFVMAGAAYQGTCVETSNSAEATITGVEIVRELQIVATRDQFGAKPDPAKRLAITALGQSWYLTACGESALHYFLTARPA